MAPHSSTLAWKIPWMEEPGRLAVHGVTKSRTWLSDFFHFSLSCIGEGNGNPLQCSCLENPRDGGAWWAAPESGVAQSRTRLKRLSSSSSSKVPLLKQHWLQEYPLLIRKSKEFWVVNNANRCCMIWSQIRGGLYLLTRVILWKTPAPFTHVHHDTLTFNTYCSYLT